MSSPVEFDDAQFFSIEMGDVMIDDHCNSDLPLAVKVFRDEETRDKEANIYKKIPYSKYIIAYYGSGYVAFGDSEKPCILLELMHLTLDKAIAEPELQDWKELLNIIIDIALGIQHVHTHHFAVQDLKLANILVNKDFEAKLCDLGGACYKDRIEGQIVAKAPEMERKGWHVDGCMKFADVYFYGEICEQIFVENPYHDALVKSGYTVEVSKEILEIIRKCKNDTAKERPKIEKVVAMLEALRKDKSEPQGDKPQKHKPQRDKPQRHKPQRDKPQRHKPQSV